MIVYGVCKSCHNHLSVDAVANTRVELLNQIGSTTKINCNRCGVTTTFRINQLKAKLPKRIRRAVLEVMIVGAIFLSINYVLLGDLKQIAIALVLYTIPAILYIFYTRKNVEAIQTFNNSKT